MGEVGLLNEDSRVELIDGEIVEMAPIGSSHGVMLTVSFAYSPELSAIKRLSRHKIQWRSAVIQNPNRISPFYAGGG